MERVEASKTGSDMATVLAERVEWTRSIRWSSQNVKRLRPDHRPVDPADRIIWTAGDAAQCDNDVGPVLRS